MGSNQTAYAALFLLALAMIVIGFQGSVGTTIGILFAPSHIVIQEV